MGPNKKTKVHEAKVSLKSDLLVNKTYWIVALKMSVLVSTLDAELPKRRPVPKLNNFVLGIYD